MIIKYKLNKEEQIAFEGVLISKESIKDDQFRSNIVVEKLDDFLFYSR